ncbi:MAG: hypothetical protein K0S71_2123 [Clostridia bacterium]|jgi:hypothetical protein|nr:hypothetical protein [Clostridia bacterium]
MKKTYKFLITFILVMSIFGNYTTLSSQTFNVTPTLQGYIDRSQGLLSQVYYLGQTALTNVINGADSTELLRLIQLNLNLVNALERDVNAYLPVPEAGSLESRNAITLHIALHHFAMALRELNNFLKSTNEQDRFIALERYFYDTVIANENINRLRQQSTL